MLTGNAFAGGPTIVSDQADYAPGSTVTLTGNGWGVGETVHVTVADAIGQTWTWTSNPDPLVGLDGSFAVSLTLPNTFISDYTVNATGSSGATAATAFTDAINTDTAIASSVNPSTAGQSVTFTATVTYGQSGGGHAAGDPVTVGTVRFGEGNNCQGGFTPFSGAATPDASGKVSATTSSLSVGSHTVHACYSGTGGSTGTGSSDESLSQTVQAPSDTTPPVITKLVTGVTGANGWYTSNVTVTWSVADPDSAVVIDSGCGTQNFTTETSGTSSSCSAHSAGGSASDSTTLKIDKSGPSASLAVTAGTAGANGWYTSDVTVSASGSDAVSDSVTCTADQFQTTETSGTLFSGSCTNGAGLKTDAAPLTVKLDKSGPSASLAVTAGTAGANGWYTSDVTVSASGSDAVSDSVTCTADQFQTTETSGTLFTGSCTNGAGLKTDAAPLTVKLDKTGPSALLSVTDGTLGNNGWYTSDVTVGTSGADSISGPTTCAADQHQTTDTAGHVFHGSCTNDAGLTTNAAPLTVERDATAPTIEDLGPTAGPDGDNGWYLQGVVDQFKVTDGLSGLSTACVAAFPSDNSGNNVANVSTGAQEGSSVKVSSGACTDRAGNEAAAIESAAFKVDRTAPKIEDVGPTVAVPDGSNGWYVHAVVDRFKASDDVSGLSTSCVSAFPSNGSGDHIAAVSSGTDEGSTVTVPSGTCADQAGNEAASIDSAAFMIDLTAPSIVRNATADSCDVPGDNGWCRGTQTAGFTAGDAISGLATDGAASRNFTRTTSVNGSSISIPSGAVSDMAGNTNTGVDATGFKIDSVAPTVSGAPTTDPNGAGWYKGDVTIAWTCDDDTSGVVSCPSNSTISGEGRNLTANSGLVSDKAGNSASADSSPAVKIDRTAPNDPTAAATMSPDYVDGSDNNWWKDTVTVGFTANGDPDLADNSPGSGVDPSTLSGDQTFTSQGPHTATDTVDDYAGNHSAAGTLDVNVDNTAPTFGTCPAAGPFILGSGDHSVGPIGASDTGGSGVDAGTSTLTGVVHTDTIGTKTVTFAVTDHVGHSPVTKACDYSVVYNWTGFFQPVDNLPGLNKAKAGSAIPVKFNLGGNQGLSILAAGYPNVSGALSCGNTATADLVEETVTAGGSSLTYDTTASQYVYVWKTLTSYANSCRTLTLKLVDGTVHQANFWFTK